jgi:hypothetical protein
MMGKGGLSSCADSSMQQAARDGHGSRPRPNQEEMHAITTTLLCDAYGLTRRLSLAKGHEVYAKTYGFVPEAAAELANAQDEYAAMLLALHQAGQSSPYDGLCIKSQTVVAEIALTLYLSDFLLRNPGLHANRAFTLIPPREVGMAWVQRSRRLVRLMLQQFCIINPLLDTVTGILFPEVMVSYCLVCDCVDQGVDTELLEHQFDQPPAVLHPLHAHFPGRHQGVYSVRMQPRVAQEEVGQVQRQDDLRRHRLALHEETVVCG